MRLVTPYAIPKWNKHDSDEIEAIFEFAFHFFHDDAHFLLFMPESKNVRLDVRIFAATYELISLDIGGALISYIHTQV